MKKSIIMLMGLESNWVRKYSILALAADVGAYAIVLWLTDFYVGFNSLTGFEYQAILGTVPFVALITLPVYGLSRSGRNPTWLFFMLAPELIFIVWALLYWSFPYIVPFLIQLPLLVSIRNRYHAKPRYSDSYGRNA